MQLNISTYTNSEITASIYPNPQPPDHLRSITQPPSPPS